MSEASSPLHVDAGRHALGWSGMMMLILTEGSLFIYLLFSYYYFVVQSGRSFFPAEPPEFKLSLPNTIILLVSSLTAWRSARAARSHARRRTALWLIVSIILGALFLAIQFQEWASKPFNPSTNAYGSLYFTITGFHMAHVAVGLLILFFLLLWLLLRRIDERRESPVGIGAAYWHFVDVVWLTVFFSLYVVPHL